MKKTETGLTLIELMVAIAIAGMLMVAAMYVTTNLSRSEAVHQKAHKLPSLEARVGSILAADLLNAYLLRKLPDGFELQTHAVLDGQTLELRHTGSVVRYEIKRLAGQNWLLRTQKVNGQLDFSELLCSGVSDVQLKLVGPKMDKLLPESEPISEETGKDGFFPKWKPLSDVVIVAINFERADRSPAEFSFRIR